MAGEIGTQIVLGIQTVVTGGAQTTGQLNAIAQSANRATAGINGFGGAHVQLGRDARTGGIMYSHSMQQASQSSFRFTFYALMAMRVGQTLLSKVFIKGAMEAANSFTHSFTRIDAVLQTTKKNISDLKDTAIGISLATPFNPTDVAEGMRTMAKAGYTISQIRASMYHATTLATIGEADLASAAKTTTTVLKAYGWEAGRAGDATALLSYYSNQSVYNLTDVMEIMGKIGATAHAYGQDMAQTLQLATAFGQVGVSASETGTMMRQLYMRASTPDVKQVLEMGLQQQGLKPLYSETTGKMTNVGQAFVALAKSIQDYESTLTGASKAEFGAIRDEAIYSMFGIRQARSFMSLASEDLKDFNKLLPKGIAEQIQMAKEYEDQYMAKLRTDFHWAQVQAQATKQALNTTLGGPALSIMKPFLQGGTEVMALTNDLINMNSTTQKLIPGLFTMSGAIMAIAGAAGLLAGVFMLVKVRLSDVGQEVLRSEAEMRALTASYGAANVAYWKESGMHSRIGFKYLTQYAAAPARIMGSLATAGSIMYYAWSKNLAGMKDMTHNFFSWYTDSINKTGSIAQTLADRIKNILKPFHRYTIDQGRTTVTEGSMFGTFLAGVKAQFDKGGSFEMLLKGMIGALKVAGFLINHLIIKPLIAVGRTAGYMFRGLAKIVGLGDVTKGFQRLGKVLGMYLSVRVFESLISSISKLGHSLIWLTGKIFFRKSFRDVEASASMMSMLRIMRTNAPGMATYRLGKRLYLPIANRVTLLRDAGAQAAGMQRAAVESAMAGRFLTARYAHMAISARAMENLGMAEAEKVSRLAKEARAIDRGIMFSSLGTRARGFIPRVPGFGAPPAGTMLGEGMMGGGGMLSSGEAAIGGVGVAGMMKYIIPIAVVALLAFGVFAIFKGIADRKSSSSTPYGYAGAGRTPIAKTGEVVPGFSPTPTQTASVTVNVNVVTQSDKPEEVARTTAAAVKEVMVNKNQLEIEYQQRRTLQAASQ